MYGAHAVSARDRTSEFSALVERLQVRSSSLSLLFLFTRARPLSSSSSQSIQLNPRLPPLTTQQAAAGASTSGQNGTCRLRLPSRARPATAASHALAHAPPSTPEQQTKT
jgi:hypothetical protein